MYNILADIYAFKKSVFWENGPNILVNNSNLFFSKLLSYVRMESSTDY